jgi:hypothetical protein
MSWQLIERLEFKLFEGEWLKCYQREIQLAEQRYEEHLRSRGLFMT